MLNNIISTISKEDSLVRIKWVSKDDDPYHYYVGLISICNQTNLSEPFAKKYHLGNSNNNDCCKTCKAILRTDGVISIKKAEQKIQDNENRFYQKFGLLPVDALVNVLASKDATVENLTKLSAKDFGGILPVCVLAGAIKSNRVCFEDTGVICPVNGGKNL